MNEDACLEQIQELATNTLNTSYVMNQHRIHKYCKRLLESLEFVRQFKKQYLMTKGDLESLKYLKSVVNSAVTNFGIYRSRSSELTRLVMQHALDEQGIVDHNEILVGAVQKITSIRKKILVERADEDVADFKEDYDYFIRNKETILDWTPTNAMKLDLKLKLDSQLNQSISRAKTRKIQFQFRVPLNEIQKIQEIGHGIYSTTHKIRFHGEIAVMKQLNPIIYSEGAVKAFYKEVQIMKALIHPRILMFQGVVHDQLTIGLILEFMEMGSLQQAFSNIPQFSPMDILHISLDVAVGVNFLHLRNILHRYLKPTNVYLDRHLRAKIGDFGLAAIRRESASSTRALPSNSSTRGQMECCVCTYQAPESLGLRAKYTEESDVYSIGMIMYQMVIWNDPFQDMQDFEIKRFIQAKNRPNIPEQCFGLEEIIKSCWDHEVSLRPRCRDLILELEKLLAQQATVHLLTDEVIIFKKKARNNQLKHNDLIEECPPQLTQAGFVPYAPLIANGTPVDFLRQEYTVYKFEEDVNTESTSITPELPQKIDAEQLLHDPEPDTRILLQNKDRIRMRSRIRQIFAPRKEPVDENISIFAGSLELAGDRDGLIDSSLIDHPKNLAIDKIGNIYVTSNNRIRKISVEGQVSTVAGPPVSQNARGFKDDLASQARFDDPTGIVVDSTGNIYVADRKNDRIRKISSDGRVTTFAGNGKQGRKDGPCRLATFDRPNGLCLDQEGNLIVADMHNGCIRMIAPDGVVSTIAGSKDGFKNGPALSTQFFFPADVAIDPLTQDFIVADQYNHQIRRISNVSGDRQVTTVAGIEECGFVDGTIHEAQFSSPSGLVVNSKGEIFVCDTGNNAIRKIFPDGTVKTIANKCNGKEIFHSPLGLILTNDESCVIVADWQSNVLRKVKL